MGESVLLYVTEIQYEPNHRLSPSVRAGHPDRTGRFPAFDGGGASAPIGVAGGFADGTGQALRAFVYGRLVAA